MEWLCFRPRKELGRLRRRSGAGNVTFEIRKLDPLGKLFAKWLAEVAAAGGSAFQADVVVPVPLHRQRERERGYNQAPLIAKPPGKRLELPYKSVLLTRVRPRPAGIC